MDEDKIIPQKKPRRWVLLRTAALLCAVIAIATVAIVLHLRFSTARIIADTRREIAAKGYATMPEEYVARLPVVPDSENAALLYLEAARLLGQSGGSDTGALCVPILSRELHKVTPSTPALRQMKKDLRAIGDDPRMPLPDYILTDSRAFLGPRRAVLDTIAQGATLSSSRFRVDLLSTLLADPTIANNPDRYLSRMRDCARLLSLDAWVASESGDAHAALADVRSGIAVAQAFNREGDTINHVVGMAIHSITVRQTLNHVFCRTSPGNSDLAALQADLERYAADLSIRPALEGEIVLLLAICDGVESGRISARTVGLTKPSEYYGLTGLPARIVDKVCTGRGLTVAYCASLARLYGFVLDDVDGVTKAYLGGGAPLASVGPQNRFSAGHRGQIQRLLIQTEKARAGTRAVACVCAALRYRNDHGEWPESLDALVPDYMASVPQDPFTGRPLLYRIEENGIAVYSVGEDLRDDAGDGYMGVPDSFVNGDDYGLRIMK